MSKEEKEKISDEEEKKTLNDDEAKKLFESELSPENAVLFERKTEKKENEFSVSYDLTNLEKLNLKTDAEKNDITNLIKNILLSSNFSFLVYAYTKIFGYLKSLFLYNLFYFIGIKLIYKILNSSKEKENTEPKAALWKRLLLFNLPELLIIFYYRRKNLTKINVAIYSLFTYLNERISFVFNSDDTKNYYCQVDQNNYNIFLIQKNKDKKNDKILFYINNPEVLAKDTFFDSVIAYPNANFEDFDFNNLTQDEQEMYEEIFTFINDTEKKIKEEFSLYNTVGTICSNLAFNNSSNFNIRNALGLKIASFVILEIYLNSFKKRKRRKILLEEKERDFNEKNIKKGYFLAVNEFVILLFRIKEEYRNYEESYDNLDKKCKKILDKYFERAYKIF